MFVPATLLEVAPLKVAPPKVAPLKERQNPDWALSVILGYELEQTITDSLCGRASYMTVYLS